MGQRVVNGEGLWVGISALMLGSGLVGVLLSGGINSSANPVSSTPQEIVVSMPTPAMTPYVETATAMATQTAVIVVATVTPSNQLPWCYTVKLGEACSLPGQAAPPKVTPTLISCEKIQLTPAIYTRSCTKTDESGANARVETS